MQIVTADVKMVHGIMAWLTACESRAYYGRRGVHNSQCMRRHMHGKMTAAISARITHVQVCAWKRQPQTEQLRSAAAVVTCAQ